MTFNGWLQIALYAVLVVALTKPYGGYMTRVFTGERTLLSPVLRPIELGIYKICGIKENEEQHWVSYAIAMLAFSLAGFVILYALQRLQNLLPLNPQSQDAISPDSAFNTSVSFVTNTNWQSYVPETTMSYLTQMAGLTVHNFVSAATGIALAIALIRGFARRSAQTIGSFWVDLTRCVLYVLLPISIIVGLVLIWQGTPQNLHAYTDVATLDGGKQLIAQGPVASQEVIKIMGTNGGGFMNANSAHPFENPNALTNLIQMLLIFSIGAGLTNVFGRMVGSQRQGWAIFAVMGFLFLVGVTTAYTAEAPATRHLPRSKSIRHQVPCRPAAIWKARRCASGSPIPCYLPLSLPIRPVALSTTCMTACCRSRAWCRWSTSCWAKSSSAAWAPDCTACCSSSSWPCSLPG
jgi:K+-transporting ATPase ATPase A chain